MKKIISLLIILSLFSSAVTVMAVYENIQSLNVKPLDDKIIFSWLNPDDSTGIRIEKYDSEEKLLNIASLPTGTQYYKDDVEKYEAYTYKIYSVYESGESKPVTVKATADINDSITSWYTSIGSNKPDGNEYTWVEYDEDQAYEGDKSLKITFKSGYASYRYMCVYQYVTVKPDTEYTLSLYSKASGISNANIKFNDVQKCNMSKSSDWEETTYTFTTEESQTRINLQLCVEAASSGSGTLWIDNVCLCRTDDETESDYITNGGFENEEEDTIMSAEEITSPITDVTEWFVRHNGVQKSKLDCGGYIAPYKNRKAVYLYHGNEYSANLYSGIRTVIPASKLVSGEEYTATVDLSGENVYFAIAYVNGLIKSRLLSKGSAEGKSSEFTFIADGNDAVIEIRLYGYYGESPAKLCIDSISVISPNGTEIISDPSFETAEVRYLIDGDIEGYDYNGEAVIYAALENRGFQIRTVTPVFAVYNDGRLTELKTGDIILDSAEGEKYYAVFTRSEGNEVRFFTWDGFGNMLPVNGVKSIDLGNLKSFSEENATPEEFKNAIAGMADELKRLISECEKKNIPCANENAAMHIIEKFVVYGVDDIENNMQERANYVRDTLVELYNEAKSNLTAYLSGDKDPFEDVGYLTGESSNGFRTDLAPSSTGEMERPTYFIGFGHFGDAINDMEFFSDIGLNIIQHEILMNDIVYISENGGYKIDYSYIDMMQGFLEKAELNNMKLSILIDVNKISDRLKEEYPEITNENGTVTNSHPKVREITDIYLNAVLTVLNENSEAIHDVCLMNEPVSRAGSYNIDDFRAWLSNRYNGDISKLNALYGTDYESFYDVPMTEAEFVKRTDTVQNLNRYFDYLEYNDKDFADYNSYVFETAKKYAPNLRYNIKIQNIFHEYELDYYNSHENKTFRGTDPELIANAYNLNGCDACAYVESAEYSIRSKFELYDFMAGMNDLPVINSEDHLYWDSDASFTENGMKNVRCDVWQGALHGRTASVIWLWGRDYGSSNLYYSSMAARPDCVYEIAKACNDLNRLAYEVTALNSEQAEAAVYYDKNLIVRSRSAMGIITLAYETLWNCGLKTEFVTDSTIERLSDYKAIIVPGGEYISEAALNEFYEYIKKGGKVYILTDGKALSYNEYGQSSEPELKESVLDSSELVNVTLNGGRVTSPDIDSLTDTVMEYVKEFSDVILYDENGDYVKNVEYQACEYNGDILISICNYDIDNDTKIQISVNEGVYAGQITDLRTGEVMTGTVTVESYKPTILKIEGGEDNV